MSSSPSTIELSPSYFAMGEEVDQVVEKFEQAWQKDGHPRIEDFLPDNPALRRLVLVELAHVDLERRVKSGGPPPVERYLARFPELGRDHNAAIDLICAEYAIRRRYQGDVSLDEYLARFPQYGRLLASQLSEQSPLSAREKTAHLSCPHCGQEVSVRDSASPSSRVRLGRPPNDGDSPVHSRRPVAKTLRKTAAKTVAKTAVQRISRKTEQASVQTLQPPREVDCPHCGQRFCVEPVGSLTWRVEEAPRIDRFELLELVGRGAFGAVYRAYDADLERTVAVKLPRAGVLHDDEDEARFVREARNAARLTHPGIVRVFEVGRGESYPFIVCEFIEGETLAETLKRRSLDVREAAQLVDEVADALEHAHQRGVVHRDLKPSNILLESAGPSYRVRLTDFGLARRDDGRVTVTLDGQVLGTPAYMSPEQAKGKAHQADRRSDVYSLGAILYELLTGQTPFRGNTNMLMHQVLHEEPRPPRRVNDRIPRDLETICLKCLEKKPDERYAFSGDLSSDLKRYLAGDPIKARPLTPLQRQQRFWARRRTLAALIAFVVFGTMSAFAAIGWQLRQKTITQGLLENTIEERDKHMELLREEKQYALHRMTRVMRGYQLAEASRQTLRSDPVRSMLLAREALELTDRENEWRVAPAEQALRDVLHTDSGVFASGFATPFSLAGGRPRAKWLCRIIDRFRLEVWRMDADRPADTRRILDAPQGVEQVRFSGDQRWLIAGTNTGFLRVFDLNSADPNRNSHLLETTPFTGFACSPRGRFLAAAGGDFNVRLWRLPPKVGAKPFLLEGHWLDIRDLQFSSDEKHLATSSEDDTVRIWPLNQLEQLEQNRQINGAPSVSLDSMVTPRVIVREGPPTALFSPNGQWLVTTVSRGGLPRLTSIADDNVELRTGLPTPHVQMTPDSRWVVLTGRGIGSHVSLQRIPSLGQSPNSQNRVNDVQPQFRHSEVARNVGDVVEISPRGRWLAITLTDGAVKVVDLDRENPAKHAFNIRSPIPERETLPAAKKESARGHIRCVRFTDDDTQLITGDSQGVAAVWSLPLPSMSNTKSNATSNAKSNEISHTAKWRRGDETPLTSVAFSHDQRWIVAGDQKGVLRIWDCERTNAPAAVIRRHESPIDDLWLWPGRPWLLSQSRDGQCRLWDIARTGQRVSSQQIEGRVRSTSLAPLDGPFRLGPTQNGDAKHVARWLMTDANDRAIRLFDLQVNGPPRPLTIRSSEQFNFAPRVAATTADGRWLIARGKHGELLLWRLPRGADRRFLEKPIPITGHQSEITAVQFSPDGRWLASAERDGDVRLRRWKEIPGPNVAAIEKQIFEPPIVVHQAAVDFLAFSPSQNTNGRSRWLLMAASNHPRNKVPRHADDYSSARSSSFLLDLNDFESNTRRAKAEQSRPGFADDHLLSLRYDGQAPFKFLSMSAHGRWMATIDAFDVGRLWDLTKDNPSIHSYSLTSVGAAATCAAFHANGNYLVVGEDEPVDGGKTVLWDLSQNKQTPASYVVWKHRETVNAALFTPNSQLVCAHGRLMSVWPLENLIRKGRTLRRRQKQTQPIERTEIGMKPKLLLRGHQGNILCLAEADTLLVSGAEDRKIRLWRLDSPVVESVVIDNGGPVTHVVVDARRRLLTQRRDGVLHWRRLSVKDLRDFAKQIAGRDFTPAERAQHGIDSPQSP